MANSLKIYPDEVIGKQFIEVMQTQDSGYTIAAEISTNNNEPPIRITDPEDIALLVEKLQRIREAILDNEKKDKIDKYG